VQNPAGVGGRKGRLPKAGGTTGGGEAPVGKTDTPPPVKPKSGGKDGISDLFDAKPSSNLPATLERGQVAGVIKGTIPAFKSCVERYNVGGGKTLPPKLIVKFVIVPSGNTSAAEMASPELKGTSVDGCVVSAIKGMKFPEYQSGNIPVTFPITIGQ